MKPGKKSSLDEGGSYEALVLNNELLAIGGCRNESLFFRGVVISRLYTLMWAVLIRHGGIANKRHEGERGMWGVLREWEEDLGVCDQDTLHPCMKLSKIKKICKKELI